ncbi:tetratricopeptide repeat protein [Chloroflexota bacterium]
MMSEKLLPSAYEDERYKVGDWIRNVYQVHGILSGTFGVVYICYDRQGRMPFAIKGLKEKYVQSDKDVDNFVREAYEWVQLERHQNIVRALFVDKIGGRPFIFMEYIPGIKGIGNRLTDWIKHRRLGLERTLMMATQIANGMEYAYNQRGLVHRDLKPDNILVTDYDMVKVTDFGLAKVIAEIGKPLGVPISACGTPSYMPPEQWTNASKADTRSDIYSFGCLLYEMLTGELPFYATKATTQMEVIRELKEKHLEEKPKPIKRLEPDFPKELDLLVDKCLEKVPNKRYPSFGEVRDELAEMYKELNGNEIAQLKFKPSELEAWHLAHNAASLNSLGKYKEALSCTDRAIEMDPGLPEIWTNRGIALAGLGRVEEALACYDRSISINPKSAVTWYDRGNALLMLKRDEEALKCFNRAIKIDPKLPEPQANKGTSLWRLGRHREALRCLNKAIEIDPMRAGSWGDKGNVLDSLSKYEEALICYNKAFKIEPKMPGVWANKGTSLWRLGRYEEALVWCDKALEMDSRDVVALLAKGASLGELDRLEDGLMCYDMVIDIDQTQIMAWIGKAALLLDLGRLHEALNCSEKALEISPDFEPACEMKKECQAALVRADQPEPKVSQLVVLELISKGASLVEEGRNEEALYYLDRAVEILPSDSWALYNRGVALSRLGKYDEALVCFDKMLEIDPESRLASHGKQICLKRLGKS